MRSGLFWKLFWLQLLAAAAVVAGALAFSRTFSVRGFAAYLEASQRERMQQVAGEVAEAYAENPDLVAAARSVRALHLRRPPREETVEDEQEIPGGRRIIVRRHMEAGLPPLQLQDADGNYVAGHERELKRERLRVPIEVDGKTVGYLAWPRVPEHPQQAQFAHQQLKHFAVIAPIALAIAALFAALITRLITRPIGELSGGAAALARREFKTRLPDTRRDELGQLAADFNRLAASLEAYDTRQSQWLADIAHELRTPLSVLRGELEAVIEGVRTIGPGLVQSLRQETERIESLVNDLHLVSLADSGGLRLNLSDADVGELATAAAKRFAARLKARGFELAIDAAPGLKAKVDVQRLDQVLGNLLANVLAHATPPGPVTVAARADGGRVVVTVSDTGPGVPPDALPRLFDRLFRVEAARTRASGGSGLGLSICKSIVEAHGGTVTAKRSAAGGLEIAIRLPCHPERSEGSPR